MRRRAAAWTLLVAWTLTVAACGRAPVRPGPAAGFARGDLVWVTFLQVNDIYTLEPVDGGRRGGIARLATLAKATKTRNPNSLFVLAGDTISPSVMSTFLRGEQMIAGLNAAGLDLATFGNHEFDFGPDVLRQRMAESRFTWVSANVLDRRTGRPFGGAQRDVLRAFGPIKVGIFGLTMPETQSTSSPGPDVVFREPLEAAREVAAALRAQGAHLVVAVTHQDMARDRALAATGDVDLILGGHEHDVRIAEEGKALITKAGSDGRYLVQVNLWLTPAGQLVERSWIFRELSAQVPPDRAAAELVSTYAARLSKELDAVVAVTTAPLEAHGSKLRTEETNVGNFLTDLMRERLGTDVAVLNGGAIRTDRTLPPGPVTKRDVLSLLPFSNVVMKLEMRGRDLRQALEEGLAQAERLGGGFLQVSGLHVAWDPRRAPGQRVVGLDVGGRPVEDGRTYTVAAPDYVVRGGDGFTAFREARVLVDEESGPQLADVVLDGLVARKTIAPRVDGRIRTVQPAS
jgi:5'-nucleotidase